MALYTVTLQYLATVQRSVHHGTLTPSRKHGAAVSALIEEVLYLLGQTQRHYYLSAASLEEGKAAVVPVTTTIQQVFHILEHEWNLDVQHVHCEPSRRCVRIRHGTPPRPSFGDNWIPIKRALLPSSQQQCSRIRWGCTLSHNSNHDQQYTTTRTTPSRRRRTRLGEEWSRLRDVFDLNSKRTDGLAQV